MGANGFGGINDLTGRRFLLFSFVVGFVFACWLFNIS
jgi:hypothetical protein